jgi:NADPH:quinone reductase-like Zn-dependent oxidoreductase
MRAYAYVDSISFDSLRAIERPDPDPGPRDVVIKVEAAALNYRDLAIMRGNYHVGVQPPLIPLSDGAGTVVAVGAEVTRIAVGDKACAVYLPDWVDGPVSPMVARRRLGGPSDGVLSEYLCLNEEEVVRVPEHIAAEEAATLPVAAVTAWHCLHHTGQIRPGDDVVVQGTGGVSTAAIQLAQAAGARVIATTRHAGHTDQLRRLGVSDVLVGADDNQPKRIFELTHGRGAETVVDVAGGSSLARSIASTKVGGRVHLVGYAAGTSASIDIFEAIRHAVTINLATAGSRTSFESLLRALSHLKIRPVVGRVHPVSKLSDAFRDLERGGTFGKIVVNFP